MEHRLAVPDFSASRRPNGTIAGLLGLFFAIDLAFSTGVASGVPYVLPVLLAARCPGRRGPIVIAAIASCLTVFGFFLPFPDVSTDFFAVGIANRAIAIVAIWVTAGLGHLSLLRESAVCDRELRLRTLVEATPDLILSVDATGMIETANAAAAKTFQCSAAEMTGLNFAELLDSPANSSDGSVVADAVSLIADGRSGTGLATIPSIDQPRTIRWTVRSLDDEGRRLAVGHDLTDLLTAQERAVRSERLAAIGQTLATLSHEAKNELLGLKFGLEQLTRSWDDRDAATDLIGEMLESQKRLWTLFEDVRGYAAPIRLKPARVSLPDVWRRAWRSLESKRADGFSLVEDFDADAVECVADAFRLEQVFRNLFENAFAACDGSASVHVSCRAENWRGEPALFVTVRDNGPGVPEEVRERLFEPFFTTKTHGTGLGLPLCRRILEAHHGDLSVVKGGPGAAFTITLPRATCGSELEPPEGIQEMSHCGGL